MGRRRYATARGRVDLSSSHRTSPRSRRRRGRCGRAGSTSPRSRRDDFPLPTLGPVLDRLRAEVVDGRGFVRLRGMPVDDRPMSRERDCLLGCRRLFRQSALAERKRAPARPCLRPGQGLSATNPNLRSYATAERQNFHIDRCDLVALLCLERAKSGGQSMLVSSMTLHNVMAERRPDLLERLTVRFSRSPRRGAGGQGAVLRGAGLQRVCRARFGAVLPAAYRLGATLPGGAAPDPGRCRGARHAAGAGRRPRIAPRHEFHAGRRAILHNHTILHARTGYEDFPSPTQAPSAAAVALLRRMLASCRRSCRCYGGITVGDRGGIICKDTRLHAPLVSGLTQAGRKR